MPLNKAYRFLSNGSQFAQVGVYNSEGNSLAWAEYQL
jgi:hypothetical protein